MQLAAVLLLVSVCSCSDDPRASSEPLDSTVPGRNTVLAEDLAFFTHVATAITRKDERSIGALATKDTKYEYVYPPAVGGGVSRRRGKNAGEFLAYRTLAIHVVSPSFFQVAPTPEILPPGRKVTRVVATYGVLGEEGVSVTLEVEFERIDGKPCLYRLAMDEMHDPAR
jgi:hypothetical protein